MPLGATWVYNTKPCSVPWAGTCTLGPQIRLLTSPARLPARPPAHLPPDCLSVCLPTHLPAYPYICTPAHLPSMKNATITQSETSGDVVQSLPCI